MSLPPEEQARANFYALLSRLFYEPPDAGLLAAFAAFLVAVRAKKSLERRFVQAPDLRALRWLATDHPPDAARRLSLARLGATVLLSLVAIAPLLLRSVATSTGMTGPLLLVGATIAALGLAGGALFLGLFAGDNTGKMVVRLGPEPAGPGGR